MRTEAHPHFMKMWRNYRRTNRFTFEWNLISKFQISRGLAPLALAAGRPASQGWLDDDWPGRLLLYDQIAVDGIVEPKLSRHPKR